MTEHDVQDHIDRLNARIAELETALEARMVRADKAEARIAWLEDALGEALFGWEDAAAYKTSFLREKHGDEEAIARIRADNERMILGESS